MWIMRHAEESWIIMASSRLSVIDYKAKEFYGGSCRIIFLSCLFKSFESWFCATIEFSGFLNSCETQALMRDNSEFSDFCMSHITDFEMSMIYSINRL